MSEAGRKHPASRMYTPVAHEAIEPRQNGSSARLEKRCGGNTESFAQFLDVGFVEGAFLVQDFGYDALGAEDWDQVFLAEVIGVHQRAQDFQWPSIRNGMMLFFVRFDQGHQDFGVLLFLTRWMILAC